MRAELALRYAELCRRYPYNPHGVTLFSEESRRLILAAELDILQNLGIAEGNARILWCSGVTEALSIAIFSAVQACERPLYYDPAAHVAMLEPVSHCGLNAKDRVALGLATDGSLVYQVELASTNALLCVCHVNNETGVVHDLCALRSHFGSNNILCVDAAQSVGKLHIPWESARIDFLALSSRKLGGPASIGALLYRPGAVLRGAYYGGGQQAGLRPGTLDAVNIYLFAQAVKLACQARDTEFERIGKLNSCLRRGIAVLSADSWPIFSADNAVPHILYFAIPGYDAAIVARILAAEYGILVGTGSACSAESKKTSHVLKAMQVPDDVARSAIRISMGYASTLHDIEALINALPKVLQKL